MWEYNNTHELMHYGVIGMKWGNRKGSNSSMVPRKTRKEAKKDAKEYSRAKMSYGEGAGTRRKLIKNTVESKARKDPIYKKEFENQLLNQDMAKHAQKARSERRRKDAISASSQTAKGLIYATTGNIGRASATAVSVYTIAHLTGADKYAMEKGKLLVKDVMWKTGGLS